MKKLALILAVIFALGVVGCGEQKPAPKPGEEKKTEQPKPEEKKEAK